MSIDKKLRRYFKWRKKERETEQCKRLADAAFIFGASIVASNSSRQNMKQVFYGGIIGVVSVALLEVAFPKTTNIIKSFL